LNDFEIVKNKTIGLNSSSVQLSSNVKSKQINLIQNYDPRLHQHSSIANNLTSDENQWERHEYNQSVRTFNPISDDKTSSPMFIKEIDTNRLTVQKSSNNESNNNILPHKEKHSNFDTLESRNNVINNSKTELNTNINKNKNKYRI